MEQILINIISTNFVLQIIEFVITIKTPIKLIFGNEV